MLLALDAGNTNVTVGIFRDGNSSTIAACAPFASRRPTNGASC